MYLLLVFYVKITFSEGLGKLPSKILFRKTFISMVAMLQIVALAMVFSCVLRKLDEDDDKEEEAEANAHPEKDEEAIAKEDDPVLMLGEKFLTIHAICDSCIFLFLFLNVLQ